MLVGRLNSSEQLTLVKELSIKVSSISHPGVQDVQPLTVDTFLDNNRTERPPISNGEFCVENLVLNTALNAGKVG